MLVFKSWTMAVCAAFLAGGVVCGASNSAELRIPRRGDDRAVLRGTVYAERGVRVLAGSVTLISARDGRALARCPLNLRGEYQFEVEVGVYQLRLSNDRDILPLNTGKFELRPGVHTLNLWPVFKDGPQLTAFGDIPGKSPSFGQENFGGFSSGENELVIRYGLRRNSPAGVEYLGRPVVVSVGFVTVLGERCVMSDAGARLELVGVREIFFDGELLRGDRVIFNSKENVVDVINGGSVVRKQL